MASEETVLLDFWASPFAMRVRVALAEKGVEYVCQPQNLVNKGSLLVEMNPIHKKVPVLIRNGKPICESLVILEYIDDVWAESSPLLPIDPYQRSQARFWADFIDKKIFVGAKELRMAEGQEKENKAKDFLENLKILEGVIGNEKFFGGDTFGYVDVALVPITSWYNVLETCGNFSIEVNCPKIMAWTGRCKERHSVSSSLPHPNKVYSFALEAKKAIGLK